MGSNWKTTKLLDHYDIRSGLSKPAKDFGSGYPFLTFKDIFYNYFTPDELGDLVQSSDKERENCSVKRGDVFLTRTSETMHELGMSCVALQDYENATFNGFCKRLRPHNNSELVPEYVGYYLRSSKFRQTMLAFSTMSTRASLNNEMIGRLEISYPSKDEQIEIARVLKKLDDKITLNRHINQTLEQMAQALFKSWFVDFDPVIDNALDRGFFEQDLEFPDELLRRAVARKAVRESADFKPLPENIRQLFPAAFEECSEPSLGLGGWVPEGWCVVVSGEEIDVRDGTHDSPKQSDHGYPLVTSKNLTSGRLDLAGTYLISPKDYEEVNKRSNVNKGDILLTMIGTLGIPCLVSTNDVNFAIKNIGLFRTSETPQLKNYFFELLKSKGMQQFLDSRAAGTTQKYLSLKVLRNILFIIPCCKVLTEFNTQAYSLENKIQQNDEQNAELVKIRDTLLPKLISGELRLSDSELDTADEALA